jgi:hypothetical protein
MTEKYKRFTSVLDDELMYIVDKEDLKELDDFIKEVTTEYLEDYSEEEIKERMQEIEDLAHDRYDDYLYENSLPGFEILDLLNNFYTENQRLKNDLDTLKRQDTARKGYNKKLMHKLDSLSGLWVTDQQVSENDKKKYHMWRLDD